MTDKEFFVSTVADEMPRFEKVLRALPQDKLDYNPDPKARTAMELASVIASEAMMFPVFLKTGTLDFDNPPKAASGTIDGLAEEMHAGWSGALEAVKAMTDDDWTSSEAKMLMGGKEVWKTTKGKFALGFLLDLIHHRGQLSVYIRPMGGKVPAIYGPSADMNE